MSALPLFPVTTVGSWPRPDALLRAQALKRAGRLSAADFEHVADEAVRALIRLQEEIGVDIVTDGEQRRDNFYSFVAEKLTGVRLMTLAEMLDVVEDKAAFERLLQTLDVPSYALSNPTCDGRVMRRAPLALDELRFVRTLTDRPVKVTLPGPYLLTRAMWVPEVSGAAYASKEALGEDIVAVLHAELAELIAAGVEFVQFDEPVLTELVFAQGQTRTFMCAALAARRDPAEELEFAVALLNRVVDGLRGGGPRIGLHVCRGNWSRDESTLLSGGYAPLRPYLERMHVDQLVLEYATARAGGLVPMTGTEIGLGVVNPRTDVIESAAAICMSVRGAMTEYAARDIFLNPDCGFGTFSNRPVNRIGVAAAKMRVIVEAAQQMRSEPGAAH